MGLQQVRMENSGKGEEIWGWSQGEEMCSGGLCVIQNRMQIKRSVYIKVVNTQQKEVP